MTIKFNSFCLKALLILIFSTICATKSFAQPQSWIYPNTGTSHIILLGYSFDFELNGQPAPTNDTWIGVFHTKENGDLECRGYQQWLGNNTTIAAWGENLVGFNPYSGFRQGEEFIFKVFWFDGVDNLIYDSKATFIEIPYHDLTTTYKHNGVDALYKLEAFASQLPDTHTVNFPAKWSMFSTYIIPEHANIDAVLNPVSSNLIIAKNGSGQVYWPFFGLNLIGEMEPGRGYQINMLGFDTVDVKGMPIDINTFELELPQGWSIMGHIVPYNRAIVDVLQPIVDHVELVKNYYGLVYWPFFGLDMIGDMQPGQGYQIKTDTVCFLSYLPSPQPLGVTCPDSISDYDGNSYPVIKIGRQCWMAENLKTSHYADGTSIPHVTSNIVWDSLSVYEKAYSSYSNSSFNFDNYGALYTWAAAMKGESSLGSQLNRVQGVCPDGWYLPTDNAWDELANNINLQQGIYERDYWFWKGIGGHLKTTTGWNNMGNGTNDYGFNGLSSGKRNFSGEFSLLTETAYWWTSSEADVDHAITRKLFFRNDNFFNFEHRKDNGFSVRCIMDTCTVLPTQATIFGNDTICLTDTIVLLQGNSPIIGSGKWSIISGDSAWISDELNPSATFHGTENREYKLTWEISNVCDFTIDTICINLLCQNPPTPAMILGNDTITIPDTSVVLQGNNPIVGTGCWQIISGIGGIIENPDSAVTVFNGLENHSYTLVWSIGNYCNLTSDTIHVLILCFNPPTQANAGPNQIGVLDTLVTLQGNAATVGQGEWTIISGIGGSIENQHLYNSMFHGIEGNEYVLTWTIDNNNYCDISVDTVIVSFECMSFASQAFAGTDQLNIIDSFTVLQANPSLSGLGQWSIISGNSGIFSDLNDPESHFEGIPLETYTLVWTTQTICDISRDTVTISFSCGLPPSQAYAGMDQTIILDTSCMLQADIPLSGSGSWSILGGAGGVIQNPNHPNSLFQGQMLENYQLEWSVNNLCGSTSDTMMVRFHCDTPTTVANAGLDQLLLMDTSIILQANTIINGIGSWEINSGFGGTISDKYDPTSSFIGYSGNTYELVWSVENNSCGSSSDTVQISFTPTPNSFICDSAITTDYDGNTYESVLIGTQCWMAENMNAHHYSDGMLLVDGTSVTDITGDDTTSYYFHYYNSYASSFYLGKLYTWAAASKGATTDSMTLHIQGICPDGWHLPSDEDLNTLGAFIALDNGGINNGYYQGGSSGNDWLLVGGHLKMVSNWACCLTPTNNYGFGAKASGLRMPNGEFDYHTNNTWYWSSSFSINNQSNSIAWNLSSYNNNFIRTSNSKDYGYSVRCLKD